jgi:hypothetical protein
MENESCRKKSDMTEAKSIHEKWREAYVRMVVDEGADPIEAADAMLAIGGLMVEHHRGTEAAKIALVAGFNLLCQQGRLATPEPGGAGCIKGLSPLQLA